MNTETPNQRSNRMFDPHQPKFVDESKYFWAKFALAIVTVGCGIGYFGFSNSNLQKVPAYAMMSELQVEQNKKFDYLNNRVIELDKRVSDVERSITNRKMQLISEAIKEQCSKDSKSCKR